MKIPERDILPRILVPEDPAAHDEGLLPGVNPGRTAEWAAAIGAVLSGQQSWNPDLGAEASSLGLTAPWGPVGTTGRMEVEVTDEMLADLAEDYNPDLGVMLERLTGDPAGAWTIPLAGALLFVPTLGRGLRAVEVWSDEERDRDFAQAVRRVEQSPPWIWQEDRPLMPGDGVGPGTWVGRRVDAPGGIRRLGAMPVVEGCALGSVFRRLELELWRYRLWKPIAGMGELLRRRPELLYRSVSEAQRCCTG